jgi:hypothetical protein
LEQIMPKRQSTAAKAARAAARQGAKYTAALRQEHAKRERRRGRSRRPGGTWWIGSHPLLNLMNDSTFRALANSPAIKAMNDSTFRALANSPAIKAMNDSTFRALANSPAMGTAQGLAMKIAFPYGGPAGRGRDDSSPG